MARKIQIGEIVQDGRVYEVMARIRGRSGEERTLYVLGERVDGVLQPRETRSRSYVLRMTRGEG